MGQVAVSYRISLEGPYVDADKVAGEIKKMPHIQDVRIVPVGFGVKLIEALAVFDDKQGANTDETENRLKSVEGVTEVEAGDVTLI